MKNVNQVLKLFTPPKAWRAFWASLGYVVAFQQWVWIPKQWTAHQLSAVCVRLVQLPVHSTITKRENTGDERHVVRACIKHTQRIRGTSYMIIIMYLNLPIIIVLYITIYPHLYITIHTYTFPYTPIQHHIPLYNTIYPYTKTPIHHHTPLYNTIHHHTPPNIPIHPYTSPYTPLHHHTTLYITI